MIPQVSGFFSNKQKSLYKLKISIAFMQNILIYIKDGGKNCSFCQNFKNSYLWNGLSKNFKQSISEKLILSSIPIADEKSKSLKNDFYFHIWSKHMMSLNGKIFEKFFLIHWYCPILQVTKSVL